MSIQRHYVTVGNRQVHYRRAGAGQPVILLHESPQSSLTLAPLAARLADQFTAIALDTPGYGESDPLARDQPEIPDYADALAETLNALSIKRCAVYGAHTGAVIALDFAVRHAERVSAVLLDGVGLYTPEEQAAHLANYCPRLEPQLDGSHLTRGWAMRRDQYLFYPWFDQRPETRIAVEVDDPETLHYRMVEYLRAGVNYGLGYRAAFSYDALAALKALSVPATLMAASDDVLASHLDRVPDDLPLQTVRRSSGPAGAADEIRQRVARETAGAGADAPAAPEAEPLAGRLTRTYVTTPQGQLLLRRRVDGTGRPLVLVHGSPVSGWAMEPLMERLAGERPVYAFDTLGNGDSDKPDPERDPAFAAPEISDYARILAAAIDAAGLDEIDLYGTHTGAVIGIETSLLLGDRIRSMVLDGVAMFDAATVAEFLECYFVDLSPRWDGTQFLTAWQTVRDGTIWFPWYRRDPAHRYSSKIATPGALHDFALEVIKSGTTYPLSYSAAFRYAAAERLPLVRSRTVIAAHDEDPLAGMVDDAVALCPGATAMRLSDDPNESAAQIAAFLDEQIEQTKEASRR